MRRRRLTIVNANCRFDTHCHSLPLAATLTPSLHASPCLRGRRQTPSLTLTLAFEVDSSKTSLISGTNDYVPSMDEKKAYHRQLEQQELEQRARKVISSP